MKKIIIFTYIIFAAMPILSQPALEIVDSKYNFGLIPNNATISQGFWFKSVGDDTLKILEIKTGCTCAIMPLPQDYILPGDSMKVYFQWNVGKRVYKIGRYPYVFTNAKDDAYRMSITGEVHKKLDEITPVSLTPYKCELSRINDKSIDQLEYTLTNRTDTELLVKIVSSSFDDCTITVPETIPANGKAVGMIKINKEFLDKEFKGSITIEFNDKENTRMTIPYRRKIY